WFFSSGKICAVPSFQNLRRKRPRDCPVQYLDRSGETKEKFVPELTQCPANPFFIEEVVQSLVEGGHLAGRRGAYRLATPIEMLQVPVSVQAVLSSRIDRLPEREKQVFQTAAVIGKTFGEALLGRVMASVTAIDDVDGF